MSTKAFVKVWLVWFALLTGSAIAAVIHWPGLAGL